MIISTDFCSNEDELFHWNTAMVVSGGKVPAKFYDIVAESSWQPNEVYPPFKIMSVAELFSILKTYMTLS